MGILTKEHIEIALEIMSKPPIKYYSSACLKCHKTFVSHQRMDNFIDCEEHKCNDNYLMVKPITQYKHRGNKMKLPKELTGEVKKFEDYVSYNSESNEMVVTAIVWDFYTQPFKPEMIEKYFGWEEIQKNYYSDRCDSFLIKVNCYELFSRNLKSTYPIGLRYIKTLSDFIDACLNSDIKLIWKVKK